jgi:hypothetical protein
MIWYKILPFGPALMGNSWGESSFFSGQLLKEKNLLPL